MDGALCRLYEDWRALGLATLAHLEAAIDFPDEDLPAGLADEVRAGATSGVAEHRSPRISTTAVASACAKAFRLRSSARPTPPISSLLNLLARRDAAIVSETAGTTRDVIEVHLDLGGWPVVLADTAGLRATGDAIEQEGVRRAKARAAAADSGCWCSMRRATGRASDGHLLKRLNAGTRRATSWWSTRSTSRPLERGDIVALSATLGDGTAEIAVATGARRRKP